MARDPLAAVGLTATPQIQPILGRTDQVRNNAGGYVFAKDLFTKAEDFLILGTTGGTYYITEDRLTVDNAGWLIQAIQADGTRVVQLITEVSTARPPRAPKNRAAVFALAMVFSCGDPAAVQAAKAAFARVVRTTDHLSMFFGYAKQLRGKAAGQGTSLVTGRALRSALASWFLAGEVDAIAWKACKARQRVTPAGETFALRDALRIAHPKADTAEQRALLGWLAGKVADGEARSQVQAVDAFLSAQAVTTEAAAIAMATERKVPWEFLPSGLLVSPTVWEALVPHLGMTALLRNLARLTRLGVLGPFAPANEAVTARLDPPNGRVPGAAGVPLGPVPAGPSGRTAHLDAGRGDLGRPRRGVRAVVRPRPAVREADARRGGLVRIHVRCLGPEPAHAGRLPAGHPVRDRVRHGGHPQADRRRQRARH
jgi:60 kDa SS-A/Ro ribonucleoprotein